MQSAIGPVDHFKVRMSYFQRFSAVLLFSLASLLSGGCVYYGERRGPRPGRV